MQVAARPVAIGGSALVASGLIALTPVSSPPDLHRVSGADVRLVDAESSLLGDLGLGSLSGLLGDLGSSSSGVLDQSSVLWIPYNIFADIVNIPYTESQALQEYAYALGPAGSTGGVAGWIPPGATLADHGVEVINGQDYYTSGGTGSWWMESIGNTWGWDNGNWPQLDALLHFVLPLQWTEGLAESVQSVAQSSFIDGAQDANCEFQCSDVAGYLGGWLTHLGNVFNSTYPITTTDTIGENGAASPTFPDGVVNVGPVGTETTAIWSGQEVPLNPLLHPFEAIWQNAIEGPANNPIMLPDIGNVFDSAAKLGQDLANDFDPLIQGSFAYWGADTLYSIPSVIGGLVHDASLGLIPNEFVLPDNGAEPITGYTTTVADVLPGLEQGFQFLLNGLEGYLNPATYGASATEATLGSLSDSTALSSELSTLLSGAGTDLASLVGPGLGTDVSSLLSELATSLTP